MSGEGMIAAGPPMEAEAPMPAIREAVIGLLPSSDPKWRDQVRHGRFDDLPMIQAAIAGWRVSAGGQTA
jgi:hypothetical protein